jgi:hypothetical protein
MIRCSLGYKTNADPDGWEDFIGDFLSTGDALANFNANERKKRGISKLHFDDDHPHISDFNLWIRLPGGTIGIPVYPE